MCAIDLYSDRPSIVNFSLGQPYRDRFAGFIGPVFSVVGESEVFLDRHAIRSPGQIDLAITIWKCHQSIPWRP